MKKILLGAAAAMAIATPAFAVSGHIDGGYSSTDYDSSSEFDAFHLGGAVQSDDMGGWNLQLDGRTTLHTWDGSSGDDSLGYAAVHANTSMGTWDFGGFVGILNYYGDGGKLIGLETRTDFGNFSLQGSTAYGDFDQFTDYSGWDVRVDGSYFINPNFAINAGVGGLWIDYSPEYDIIELSVGAAYQFANALELYGEYINTDGEPDGGTDYQADTFRIGVRYHLNGGTLQEETNDGATWEGAEQAHDMLTRW